MFEFHYMVKFVIGKSDGSVIAPGYYWTAINVLNPALEGWFPTPIPPGTPPDIARIKKRISVALPGETPGPVSKIFEASLLPHQSMEIDTFDIFSHLKESGFSGDFAKGFVLIRSNRVLEIVTVYTSGPERDGPISTMDVERVRGYKIEVNAKANLLPIANDEGSYCVLEKSKLGKLLIVTVANHGGSPSVPCTTRVDFGKFGIIDRKTPALAPGQSVRLKFPFPSHCYTPNCEFTIYVDVNNVVPESDKTNNKATGVCIG